MPELRSKHARLGTLLAAGLLGCPAPEDSAAGDSDAASSGDMSPASTGDSEPTSTGDTEGTSEPPPPGCVDPDTEGATAECLRPTMPPEYYVAQAEAHTTDAETESFAISLSPARTPDPPSVGSFSWPSCAGSVEARSSRRSRRGYG